MLTLSTITSPKISSRKATLILVGLVSVFVLTSLAIGIRTSNAMIPGAQNCRGGNDDGAIVTCTSTSTVVTTSQQQTTSTETTTTTTTTAVDQQSNNPLLNPSVASCGALKGIAYQSLAAGTQLTIAFNGNGQMTFTVPSQSFTWNWYWIPANGMNTNTLGLQITNAMWASGHAQNFSFFVATLNGQTGIVLQSDYALSHLCG